LRTDLILEDTTLRDGEQAPGVAFSARTKAVILDGLLRAGVRWIELGIPAIGGEELRFVREAAERQDEGHLVVWNRGIRSEVQDSLDLGFDHVHIGLPTSDLHLEASVRRDRSWLLATARELIGMAKDAGAFVSISAEDLARTEIGFLQEYAGVVREAGADRLRLSDTVGTMTPEQYGTRVRAVVSATDIDVQCHAHNDFGLGLANTLAGLAAGARYFHVTVNGMGERAGMADLAQASALLQLRYDRDLGIDLAQLTGLSQLVVEATGHNLLPWQPVVGASVFTHESGIHVGGMLRDTATFEPFSPELVGGARRYVLGKHSGRAAVRWALQEAGIRPEEELLGQCLQRVRQLAIERGSPTSEAVCEIYLGLVHEHDSAEPSAAAEHAVQP
jgi:isopropylmalate/homocitrate/citramalate synthase